MSTFPPLRPRESPKLTEAGVLSVSSSKGVVRPDDPQLLDELIRLYKDVKPSGRTRNSTTLTVMLNAKGLCVLPDESADEIDRYIDDHPYLITALEEALVLIQEFFRPASRPRLELWIDQEDPDIRQLVIRIPANDPADSAVRQLSEFRRMHWLGQPYDVRRCLAIRF